VAPERRAGLVDSTPPAAPEDTQPVAPAPGSGALVRALASRPALVARRRVGLLISLVALVGFGLWAARQDAPTFPTEPQDIALLAVAVLVYALVTLVRGWRWHRIMRHNGVAHERSDAFALCVVGYAGNNVLPARGGELLRIFLLSERSGARKRDVLGSVIAERVLDALALVLLLVLLSLSQVAGSSPGDTQAVTAFVLLGAAAAGVVAALLLRRRERLARVVALIRPIVAASRRLLGLWGLGLFMVTAGLWILEGVIVWLVGQSLGLEVSIVEGVFVLVLAGMFAVIPSAPGYVGTFDAGMLFALGRLGIGDGVAVAYALLVRFVLYVPITVVGLALLVFRYGGIGVLRSRPWNGDERRH
jgi:glycosyltransferase 2 family protein